MAVAGDYAYVADESWSLRVVDVSDPVHPTEVGSYNAPGYAYGVAVAGNYAYVADYGYGLRVVDVSNPARPIEVGSYDTPGYPHDVIVVGNYAYVADDYAGLRVVKVSDPTTHPAEVSYHYNTWGWCRALTVKGSHVHIADAERGGLRVINVSNPADPIEDAYYDTPGDARGVALVGGYSFIADGDGGLLILRLTAPWLNWSAPYRPLLLPSRGAAIEVEYANIAVPTTLTATLGGPAVFADGSQALTANITSANGSYM